MGDRTDARAVGVDDAARRLSAWIARGDQGALDEFYRAWFNWCYVLARTLTGRDESFCLDVVQDAMLRVARSLKAMKSHRDLERWMTRVVHTTALDLLRRESRRAARERAAARGEGALAADVELAERIAWVRDRLAAMPAQDGWLVWLRFGRGRTLEEAGAVEGIGGQAAHGRIRRTIRKMQEPSKEVASEHS